MPNHAMAPHYSGTTLEAQKRYTDGIKDCLLRFFNGRPIEADYLIVDKGKMVSHIYTNAFKT
jgi:formate dehydrogenase